MFARALRIFLSFSALVAVLGFASPNHSVADDALRATLKNGLKVVIVRNNLAPAVAVELNYLVGSVETPPGFSGMAHAQEHMMFRGSPGLSAEQVSALSAAAGGDFNAETQSVVTQYQEKVATQDLEIVLHMEAVRMRGVLDSQKEWEQERGAIEQEVDQDLSNPEYLLSVQLLKKLFPGTPYEHDGLGDRASFDKTTGEMLQKFHRDWYAPNNAVLVIVGDVKPEETLKMVRRLFEPIPSRPIPPRPKVDLKPPQPSHVELESNLPYGIALVANRLPGYDSPDYAAGQVLADVLASQRGNLYALVPEGKALSTSYEGMSFPKIGAGFAVAAFPQGGDGKALIARMKEIIAEYVSKGVPEELVEAAKRREIAEAEFQKNSIFGLASLWSQAVAVEGRTSPQDDIDAVKKVTVADVNRVARAFLVNQTAVTAILTPRQSGKPVEATGFSRGKESFAPSKDTKPVRLPPWASRITKTLPAVAKPAMPTVVKLENGLRLLVITTTASDAVSVYGEVKDEPLLETPKGKDGVNEVLSALFTYGTTKLDRLAFQAALDEIAAQESAGTSFSLTVLKQHFARGVELLADNLLRPALPADAFKVVQTETASAVAGELQSPEWLTKLALAKGLYPKGDPKLRHPTPETVSALTLEDVKTYYRTVFRPELTTIVVIGAVTPAEARKVIEQQFGNWRGTGRLPATDLPRVPLNPAARVKVPDRSRIQDEVTLAEVVGITRLHPDYYPLQVGTHVLSGGFYATRLERELRSKTGLVYAVEAFLQAEKTRAVFGVFYGCEPKNVERAREMAVRILDRMQREEVTADELRQAKTMLLRQILLSRTSTASIAAQLLHLQLIGLPLDEPVRAERRYRAITAAEVKRAFAKWLRPEGFVQVTRGAAAQ
jgi:zinc protease